MPKAIRACNCTFCDRTGAVWGYYDLDDLKVVSAPHDAVYSPNVMNHHQFCSKCGSNTHGSSPDWASMYTEDGTPKDGMTAGVPEGRVAAINTRMLLDFNLDALEIETLDGRNNW